MRCRRLLSQRAYVFGAVTAVFAAPPIILVLAAFGSAISATRIHAWQHAFAVVLGALVTP